MVEIEPPELEDFKGFETNDPDVTNILGELRKAAKDFKNALEKGSGPNAIVDALNRYKDASDRLMPRIDKFITNPDYRGYSEAQKLIINKALTKFSTFYNKLTDFGNPDPARGGDDVGGSDISRAGTGPNNLLEQLKALDPEKNGLGEDGVFSRFLKKIGAKSKNFIDLAKDYLKTGTHNEFKADLKKFRDLYSSIKPKIETADVSNIDPKIKSELDRLNKKINNTINEIKFKEDQESKNPGKAKGHSKLSFLIKFLVLLETLGSGIMAWWLIKQYCDNHSGCLVIAYEKGQSYTTNNKKYCEEGTLPSNYSEKTTYGPELCFCSEFTDKSGVSLSESDNCQKVTDPKNNKFTPDNTAYKGIVCRPQDGNITNIDPNGNDTFLYYSYIIMTPFDGAVDIFNKTSDITKNTLKDIINMIVHAIIILAIVGGVLLVLYIVYKVVANRKPAEAIKIEPSGSKFGNILGNLNKFSRYHMQPISHPPLKFGNRFNF